MENSLPEAELRIPEGMRGKLERFRRQVWIVKISEGVLAAIFGLVLSYLAVFISDRLWDTPAAARIFALLFGAVGLGVFFPLKCHRWVWKTQRMENVARLLRFKFPRLGDQLLGIVELARSDTEQSRSHVLVQAAMNQVDDAIKDREFTDAVPQPRHVAWAWAAGVPLAIAGVVLFIVPEAGTNALARWLFPWQATERYTFARINDLPESIVVPYAESFEINAKLAEGSKIEPSSGVARISNQSPVRTELEEGRYDFKIPPQKEDAAVNIAIGDVRAKVDVSPKTRPELTSMTAKVTLPDYLKYSRDLSQEVLGGSVSLVKGSKAQFVAVASRPLVGASIDGESQQIKDGKIVTNSIDISDSKSQEIVWKDHFGLTSKTPLTLKINALDDEAPTVFCEKLNQQQVIQESKVLSFDIRAGDDFGIKVVGLEWVGVADPARNPNPAKGEKIIAAGDPEKKELQAVGTFSAKTEKITPQTLQIRVFVEDYLPDRKRVYSPVYTVHVMSAEEHAIWLTEQLGRWIRQASEVYEHEQQLHDVNRQLRQLTRDEIDKPENRRKIEQQAAAEQANAARLSALTDAGKTLVEEATSNDQFNVRTLETWAEMLSKLEEIADKRMPSVADLLSEAANAQGAPKPGSEQPNQKSPPQAGNVRDNQGGSSKESEPGPPSKAPSVVDVESSFNEPKTGKGDEPPSKSSPSALKLPSTVVQGGGADHPEKDQACPPQLDQAVEDQADLLAEFEKIREELEKILANLEQSTFVKRLKGASRRQLEIATDLNRGLFKSFGAVKQEARAAERDKLLAKREIAQGDNVYKIQEDLEAFYNRKQEIKFKKVLDDMKDMEVVNKLKDMSRGIAGNLRGQSIVKAEFWADNLDRWAEQLVGPGDPGGT